MIQVVSICFIFCDKFSGMEVVEDKLRFENRKNATTGIRSIKMSSNFVALILH